MNPALIYQSQCKTAIKGAAEAVDPNINEEAEALAESAACRDAYTENRRDNKPIEDYRANDYEAARRRVAANIPASVQRHEDAKAFEEETSQFLRSAGELVLPSTLLLVSPLAVGINLIFDAF